MRRSPSPSGLSVVIAASVVSVVLGSVHAFSVLIEPLEARFDVTRSTVSLVYSFALLALTVSVLLGPSVFGRLSGATFVLVVSCLAALGVLVAGTAGSFAVVVIGYSLIFGAANGLGYGYGLQIAAQYSSGREGLAMGVVTASYALGAVLAPAIFEAALVARGFAGAMIGLGVTLLLAGAVAAVLLRKVNAQFRPAEQTGSSRTPAAPDLWLLWLGYFGGVLAGLMVIGHAAGILASFRPDIATWVAPVVIAIFNLGGSLVSGRLADRLPLGAMLAGLAILTTVSLFLIAVFGATFGLISGLALLGFAYGGTIAAYPAAIAKIYGMRHGPKIYGRIFTAWGCAGLAGPLLAGYLFDQSGDYRMSLVLAGASGAASALFVVMWFRKTARRGVNVA